MLKKSKKPGKSILPIVEIQGVSQNGLWILVENQEFFLSFAQYPWFAQATIKQIYDFQFLRGKHLYWPTLDVDIEVEALKNPRDYPLKYK